MAKAEHQYGTVPRSRRRLFIVSCAAVGLIMVVLGIVINWVSHTPVAWGWLAVAVGFVMGCYAFYLWIRLSD